MSTALRTVRSVAVEVSARRGNVASEAMEDRDICLGWKLFEADDGPRGPDDPNVARFAPEFPPA